jgi:hypothetical protein
MQNWTTDQATQKQKDINTRNIHVGDKRSHVANDNVKVDTLQPKGEKQYKYHNKKTIVDEITFDSRKEADYYIQLKLMKVGNMIKDFTRQVVLPLNVNGFLICKIILDFQIINPDGSIIFVDIKGFDKKTGKFISTSDWKIKRKLAEAIYAIKIILK